MRSVYFSVCLFLLFGSTALAQKKIAIQAVPADAIIYELVPVTNELKQLGVGNAIVEVKRKSETTVVLQKPGFAPLRKVYSTLVDTKLPKEELLQLRDREIALKVSPADAKVLVNGEETDKIGAILVREGEKIDVEVKKPGFVSIKKTYSNQANTDVPPVTDNIKLTDRVIKVIAAPADAAIVADNQVVGTGSSDVIVGMDKCVVIKVVKDGYIETEKTYCNKEGLADLPLTETFTLSDRIVMVKTVPEDASIKINDKVVGSGSFNVKVLKNECVEVTIEKEGYIPFRRSYCNQTNAPEFSIIDAVSLAVDEAFVASAPADFVNVNNIVEINPALQADAWKIMSQAIMNVFDVIEITDKETGYLRTAWAVKKFQNNTVRTRIILKIADSNTLKYTVKLFSEASGKAGSSVNDDSQYTEWNRVLEQYKTVVSDIQTKLK